MNSTRDKILTILAVVAVVGLGMAASEHRLSELERQQEEALQNIPPDWFEAIVNLNSSEIDSLRERVSAMEAIHGKAAQDSTHSLEVPRHAHTGDDMGNPPLSDPGAREGAPRSNESSNRGDTREAPEP